MPEAGDPEVCPLPKRRVWPARLTHLLFALTVWFIATFAYLGDLGQWSDDYAYDKRDVATGENSLALGESIVPFFWRPLFYMSVPWLQSELGGHWTNHLINAGVRGIVSGLVYLLLRRMGVCRGAACGAAVGLLAFPAAWEVSFWLSAMPTGVMGATFLAVCLICLRWFRAPAASGWRAWMSWGVMPPVIFALAFSIPCWNEQIGAAVPAVFFLALGERRSDGKRPIGRGLAATVAACAAQALYLGLYWSSGPGGTRGSGETMARPNEWPERIAWIADGAWNVGRLHDFGGPALRAGFDAMAAHPGAAVAGIVVFVLAAGGWITRVARDSRHDSGLACVDRSLSVIGFGVAVFLLAWLPLVVVRGQSVEPRMWLAPAIGGVIAIAGCVQVIAGALRRGRAGGRPGVRFLAAGTLVGLVVPALVVLVGVQSAMHQRKELDARQAAEIVRLAPTPEPWTVFVALEIMQPRGTRWSRFVTTFYGQWENVSASTPALRLAYRREDLAMGWRRFSARWSPRIEATREGLVFDDRLVDDWQRLHHRLPGATAAPTTLSWEHVIPFVIDPDGRVVLVREVSARGEDGRDERFEVRTVGRLVDRAGESMRVARVRLADDPVRSGNRVEFEGG
jgi:hypothetical protein